MAKTPHVAFAAVLEQLMKTRGLTQAELSRALGIDPGLISKYLRGMAVPTVDRVDAIAEFFRVDALTLERLAGYRANSTSSVQDTIDPAIASLYEATVARVREVIEGVPAVFVPTILAATRVSTELARDNVEAAIEEARRQAGVSNPLIGTLEVADLLADQDGDGRASGDNGGLTAALLGLPQGWQHANVRSGMPATPALR